MADLWSADFTGSSPATVTTVNSSGNTLNFSGPSGAGLYMANTAADGWGILGWYANSGQEVAAADGRVWELTWIIDGGADTGERINAISVTPTGAGLADEASTNTFSVHVAGAISGYVVALVANGAEPDDAVQYAYSYDTLYTLRLKGQSDGSMKAYIFDGATETFIGSSKVGAALHTNWTGDLFVSTNQYKSWGGVNGGSTYNAVRVYDTASGAGDNFLTTPGAAPTLGANFGFIKGTR